MIRILAVYVGNDQEAFIEQSFADGVNIIYSNDNHVGKTVVMQSIMFTLGALPQFPSGFPFKNYTYIVDLDVDGRVVSILRNRDSFVVIDEGDIVPLESVGKMNAYWNDHITILPMIVKDGRSILSGLALYTQMAFVPQDNRSSSRIFGGYYNKNDFMEMLYSSVGLSGRTLDTKVIRKYKERKTELKIRRKELLKQARILKQPGTSLSIVSPTVDREEKARMIQRLNELKNGIVDLRNRRNRALVRMKKNEGVLRELNSLNREMQAGSVFCLNCGSEAIGYKMEDSDFVFDITTTDMRQQIIESIKRRIAGYEAEVSALDIDIRKLQGEFNALSLVEEITLGDVLANQDSYRDVQDTDQEISRIDDEIEEINRALISDKAVDAEMQADRKAFKSELLDSMTAIRRRLSDGIEVAPYEDLFTPANNPYSGSEATEYFVARLAVLAGRIQHGLPIIIDSFRAEELSTSREAVVLDLFEQLSNQVILTATLKEDEVVAGKYFDRPSVNRIDYCGFETNKLLSNQWKDAFASKVEKFGVILNRL